MGVFRMFKSPSNSNAADAPAPERAMQQGEAPTLAKFDEVIFHQRLLAYSIALPTLLIGCLLIYAANQQNLINSVEVKGVVRDIGISFLVAAVVGILYDVFTKGTEYARTKLTLDQNSEDLFNMGAKIQRLIEQLAGTDDPVHKIRTILERELKPNLKYAEFIDNTNRLLEEVFEIHRLSNNRQTKEIQEYMRLIGWTLGKCVVRLATQTRTVLEGMTSRGDGVYRKEFFPPEWRVMTLEILAAQMRAMRSRDSYDSVANIWLYSRRSKSYLIATKAALQHGMKIRRIFNICEEESKPKNERNLEKAIKFAREQIAEFSETQFEYRFLTNAILPHLNIEILNAAGVDREEDMKSKYFGHFYHTEDRKMLAFDQTDEKDREGIDISVYSLDGDNDDCVGRCALFEHLWGLCDERAPDDILAALTSAAVARPNGQLARNSERRFNERRA